jgi:hypothetical protein
MIFENTYNTYSITEEGKVGMKFTIYISNLSQKYCLNLKLTHSPIYGSKRLISITSRVIKILNGQYLPMAM